MNFRTHQSLVQFDHCSPQPRTRVGRQHTDTTIAVCDPPTMHLCPLDSSQAYQCSACRDRWQGRSISGRYKTLHLSTLHLIWNPPSLHHSLPGNRPVRTLLLETSQLEKYNTKHIQTKPFSATLLSAGTLPELERQLLSDLAARHAPSIALEIRSSHNTANTHVC